MPTSATSPTSTVLPLVAVTTTRAMSSTFWNNPMLRTTSASSPRLITPPPTLLLLAVNACATWSIVTPNLRSSDGLMRTWYSLIAPPKLSTSATPGTCRKAGRTTQSCNARTSLSGMSGGVSST